jgi:peptide-methionine (S)-S-oxide reductase
METATLANGPARLAVATLAGGCFWCTEAVFKRVKGIEKVISGYTGGKRENPTYEQVSTGATGHAECLQIEFDPKIISYNKILDIFFATHDPTQLNRQGNDVGTQYRSAIFYHNEEQKKIAEEKIKKLSGKYEDPIVTQLNPYFDFYPAEDYHKDYYDQNRNINMYCQVIIDPKIKKLLTQFSDEVKEEYK